MDVGLGIMMASIYILVAVTTIGVIVLIYKIAKLIINYLREKNGLNRV